MSGGSRAAYLTGLEPTDPKSADPKSADICRMGGRAGLRFFAVIWDSVADSAKSPLGDRGGRGRPLCSFPAAVHNFILHPVPC